MEDMKLISKEEILKTVAGGDNNPDFYKFGTFVCPFCGKTHEVGSWINCLFSKHSVHVQNSCGKGQVKWLWSNNTVEFADGSTAPFHLTAVRTPNGEWIYAD